MFAVLSQLAHHQLLKSLASRHGDFPSSRKIAQNDGGERTSKLRRSKPEGRS
jgi:hypothetical protein